MTIQEKSRILGRLIFHSMKEGERNDSLEKKDTGQDRRAAETSINEYRNVRLVV